MPEYDVHYVFSGYERVTAESEEAACEQVNKNRHADAKRIEHALRINVVDPSEEYVTDVLEAP